MAWYDWLFGSFYLLITFWVIVTLIQDPPYTYSRTERVWVCAMSVLFWPFIMLWWVYKEFKKSWNSL